MLENSINCSFILFHKFDYLKNFFNIFIKFVLNHILKICSKSFFPNSKNQNLFLLEKIKSFFYLKKSKAFFLDIYKKLIYSFIKLI